MNYDNKSREQLIEEIEEAREKINELADQLNQSRLIGEIIEEIDDPFKLLIQLSPYPVAIHKDGRFVLVNQACLELLGANHPEDILGKDILDIVHPDYKEQIAQRVNNIYDGKLFSPLLQEKLVRLDGRIIDVEVASNPIKLGNDIYVLTVTHDISRAKKTEDELIKTEKNYCEMFNAIDEYVFLLDPATARIIDVNKSFIEAYSLPIENLLGQEISSISCDEPEYRLENIKIKIKEALKKKHINFEWKAKKHNNEIFWIEVSLKPAEINGNLVIIALCKDITDKKNKEEMLHLAMEKFESIVRSIPHFIYHIDREGRILWLNPKFEEIFDKPLDEIIGSRSYDLFPIEDGDIYYLNDQTVINEDRTITTIERNTDPFNGEVKFIEVIRSPLHDSEGNVVGIQGLFRDVSSRLSFEEKIKQNKQYHSEVLDSINDCILVLNDDGRITDCNRRFEVEFGYNMCELNDITIQDILDEEFVNPQSEVSTIFQKVLDTGQYALECRMKRKDKLVFWSEISFRKAIINEKISIIASVRNINERKQLENELLSQAIELDLFFRTAVDMFCIADTKGFFRLLNPQWEKTLGYSISQLENKLFLDFVHPDDLESTIKVMKTLENNQEVLDFTNRYRHADGTYRWIEWRSFPYNGLVYAAARDVTYRKNAEEEKERLIADLKNSKEMIEIDNQKVIELNQSLSESEAHLKDMNQNKDKLFSIISHDLRNPLSSFLSLTEMMIMELHSLSINELHDSMVYLNQSATSIYKLLDNLLLWSKLQRGIIEFHPDEYKLHDIVDYTVELFQANAREKQITINNLIQEDALATVDLNLFSTIIRNLTSNSIKFTPLNGHINISAKFDPDKFEVTVADSGVGITKEVHDKLFKIGEKVTTLGTKGEIGTGLGLILCKEFVEKHNGTLKVSSIVGKGTAFTFSIPQKAWE